MPSLKDLRRLCLGAILLATLAVGVASPADASAPPNDTPTSATVIGGLPFSNVVDTTDATTDADEEEYASICSASTVGHAVWYTGTATADTLLIADASESSFSASILVLQELSPGVLHPTFCGEDFMGGSVTAGSTYYVMVFGDGRSADTGGELDLKVREALPPPELELRVSPIAFVDRHGIATVSGTLQCTSVDGTGEVINLDLSLFQKLGRNAVDGFSSLSSPAPCDGSVVPWVLSVDPEGRFKPGLAKYLAASEGCGPEQCTLAVRERSLLLLPGT